MATQRMAPVDAAWLHMDRPTNELVVTAVLWFDGTLSDDVVRETVQHRLVDRHPRFRQRVRDTGRAAWWVDVVDFDAMVHVTRERLPEPGDLATLTRRVTELAGEQLPSDAPLWRIHVLDGYLGGSALVARIHHCLADGMALFTVLLALSDEACADDAVTATSPAAMGDATSTAATSRVVGLLSDVRKVLVAVGTLLVLPPDRRTPLRRKPEGRKQLVWSAQLPLNPVTAAAKAAQVTVNDVVVTALSEALHRQLTGSGSPAADVRAVVPIDLRPSYKGADELGNYFGLLFVRLPTAHADAGARLAAVRRRTTALKSSAMPFVTLQILRIAGLQHRRIVQLLVTLFSIKASVVLTNVRGPATHVHLGGHRLEGVIAWPPQSGTLGGGVSLISYAGQVTLGVMADANVVDDPGTLLAGLTDALTSFGQPGTT